MSKYIKYTIEALENLKFAETRSNVTSESTLSYIPGTAIRGAYIYKYMKKNRLTNLENKDDINKILKDNILFLNAYPMSNNKRGLPLPKCYYALKDDIRKYKSGVVSKLLLTSGLDEDLEVGSQKVRLTEYITYNKKNLTSIEVKKGENLHINKNRSKEDNILFRYEYLEKGQLFKGLIKIEDEYYDELRELIEEEILYLGGSKGSGYGKCRIVDIKLHEDNPEYSYEDLVDDKMYLIALSDIIYQDKNGRNSTNISEEYLCDNLNLQKIKQLKSSIDVKYISTFNNTWNARSPQLSAISAGSVFLYEVNKDEITKNDLERFVSDGIGIRKNEGFGRIAIFSNIKDFSLCKETKDEENIELVMNELTTKFEKDQYNLIVNNIVNNKLEAIIPYIVLNLYEKIKRDANNMNSNQWGAYKNLFMNLINMGMENGKANFEEFLNNIADKRSTSYIQLESVKGLKDIFTDYVENQKIEYYIKDFVPKNIQKPLKKYANFIDEETIYRTNLKVLDELCTYHIRKEE